MGRRRRKSAGRKAYLKKMKSFYDPYSPYSLRTRGVKVLNFKDPIPVTVMHGKRGLTIARAEQLPVLQAQLRKQAVEALEAWQGLRHNGLTEFHRIVVKQRRKYVMEVYFSGQKCFVYQRNEIVKQECLSKNYITVKEALKAIETDNIFWSEVLPLATPPPAQSVPPCV